MNEFFDIPLLVLVMFVVIVGLIAGRVRHEGRWEIALGVIGTTAMFVGLAWAVDIGPAATTAAAIATGGIVLTERADSLGRKRKAAEAATQGANPVS